MQPEQQNQNPEQNRPTPQPTTPPPLTTTSFNTPSAPTGPLQDQVSTYEQDRDKKLITKIKIAAVVFGILLLLSSSWELVSVLSDFIRTGNSNDVFKLLSPGNSLALFTGLLFPIIGMVLAVLLYLRKEIARKLTIIFGFIYLATTIFMIIQYIQVIQFIMFMAIFSPFIFALFLFQAIIFIYYIWFILFLSRTPVRMLFS